jgi:periplasmic divalent cation tolerance protein
MATPYNLILISVPDKKTATRLSDILLSDNLVACINVIPGVESIYKWQGKTEKSKESLLILKTKKSLAKRIIQTVKNNHPYKVPEIISLAIDSGSKDYLNWIKDSCSNKK